MAASRKPSAGKGAKPAAGGARKAAPHFLVHGKKDAVGVMAADVVSGQDCSGWNMETDATISIKANHDIPLGHKIALGNIAKGATVIKYGCSIGKATQAIKKGDHVHTHNLKTARW